MPFSRLLPFVIIAVVTVLAAFVPSTRALADKPPPPPYRVVVHPSNPTTQASRKFLTDAFLKKTTQWPNGTTIHPVDLLPDSPVRHRFSEDVLKRSVAAVKNYWQQVIFSGRGVPPPELTNDDEVIQYVMKHEGGIGYVSGTANIGETHTVVVQ